MSQSPTLISLFVQRVAESPDRSALQVKRDGVYRSLTWNELARDVRRAAAALVRLGVQPGDRIVQVSENRYEWIVCDLAIQMAQAVHVPVHASLSGEQVAFQVNHCEAAVVLLSTAEQAEKLASSADSIAASARFISFDPCRTKIGSHSIGLLAEITDAVGELDGEEVERQALANVTPDSLATILYTSGTTGEPKGVMLSHHNLVSNTLATLEVFQQEPDDVRLCFLPLSHIFARTCELYTWIAGGCQLALAESRETVFADCASIRPTLIIGVPYFFDKVCRVLEEQSTSGQSISLRQLLGGNVRLCASGGAALPNHVFDYFSARGLPLLQGYGLTESSPVITASTLSRFKRGTVGPPIPGIEVEIANDGEVLTRGPHVMLGYWKDQRATDEIIKDGWLHTGDIGELDDDGLLRITGRKKEIIVTSGGKNVAPVYLESLLAADPLILQAMIVGDGRSYLTALIVPNPEALRAEIMARGIPVASKQQALTHPQVLALFEQQIRQRLRGVSPYEQVGRFTLLDRAFSMESGELTPKLSLRRKVIEANFADRIEAMYRLQ